jgi:F-type H+-transporting ATPase subunit delta
VRPQDAVAELRAFSGALQSSPELHNALVTPAVPIARKRAVVKRIADALQLSRITHNFLLVLVDHRRIAGVAGIVDAFETVMDERLGFARAEVTSAAELSDPQRGAVAAQLERLTGKRIRARYAVDAGLIGGVVARIGSTVYDGSVRERLHNLERRMSAEA